MSRVIQPSIGSPVLFWESGAKRALAANNPSIQPEDAGVCYVWNDRMVNLSVVNSNGFSRPETSITLVQPDDPWNETTGPHCSWMPYQIAVASAAPKSIE